MEYRILGRTGLRVSAVALGCEGFIHKTPEEVCADFDFAIGHGVNFIDIYSPNPELRTNIGAALEGRFYGCPAVGLSPPRTGSTCAPATRRKPSRRSTFSCNSCGRTVSTSA